MASKKQWYSVVAATAIAASFTISGCGSSSSGGGSSSSSVTSSTSSTSSNASSSSVGPVTVVKVSDAYVINANVTAGSAQAILEDVNGSYEFNTSISDSFTATGGVNDMNGNNKADNGEPYAPELSAPAGYANINPFTSMIDNGASSGFGGSDNIGDLNQTYPAAGAVNPDNPFDFDVVAEGANNIDVAKETAKAALTLSAEQNGMTPPSSSSISSSSSSSSVDTNSTSILRPLNAILRPIDGETSSSSDSNSSASSSSSSTGDLDEAFAEIKACTDNACIDGVVTRYMGAMNGTVGGSSSSSDSSSSDDNNSSSSSSAGDTILRPIN